MKEATILDQLTLINLDIDQWSGQTKLDESEITLGEGGSLPPKEFADLGSKWLVDRKRFRVFNSLRRSAAKLCLSVGTKFCGGYAISNKDIDFLISELEGIEDSYESEIDKFVLNYQSALAEWAELNPGREESVYRSAPSPENIRQRFKCEFTAFKIGGATQKIHDELEQKAKGLGGEVFAQITAEAWEFYSTRLLNQEAVNKKSLQILLGWHRKLTSLSFLNGKFRPMIALLDEAIAAYQGCNGPLKGRALHVVMAAVLAMSNKDYIDQYLAGSLKVEDLAEESWERSTGQTSLVPASPMPIAAVPAPTSVFESTPDIVVPAPIALPLPKVTGNRSTMVSRNAGFF